MNNLPVDNNIDPAESCRTVPFQWKELAVQEDLEGTKKEINTVPLYFFVIKSLIFKETLKLLTYL
jgi:hypothetical protein